MSGGHVAADVLAGGGELGERMRAIDWANTPLGPVESWPQSLTTCIRIILTSSQPMFVWWGEQLINLYNDAYCSILGGKHPWALGRPAAEVWREIWEDVGPRAETAMRENRGTFDEALLLIMERNGYREETYYTFSYSPVPGDRGATGGILCANSSDTQRIFGERQQALLRDVGAATSDARTVGDVCTRAMTALAGNARDLPFAMLYLLDGKPRLAGTCGISPSHALCARLDMLPVGEVERTGAMQTCSIAGIADLPTGAWEEPATELVGVPVAGDAVLVVARNPYRRLDDDYRRFLELLARQIVSALGAAKAYEVERQRAEALAELDRAKTTFFSNISHEFRTPLTLMIGPTEDALRAGKTLTGDALESVHRNELRLLKLVNALLDFSRIEAGRVRARFEPTDLAQLTRELASAFRSAMERAHLQFEVDAEGIGEPIYVDHGMWEKVVLNLLSNALKFTFEGGVRIALHDAGSSVELVVEDTGTGIPAEELPRLFERFHRVEGAKSRTHEGSGIGLALAHELVKLHRGEIAVESTVGKGTRFTVRIPKGSGHLPAEHVRDEASTTPPTGVSAFVEEAMRWLGEDADVVAEPVHTGESLTPAIDNAKILVADDNADMRDYLRRLLGERWHVTVVRDGERALEAARRERPDLVLTDVMMPGLDGFGLLRALRDDADLASVPVVMLSARAGEEARIEGIEAGADDYLIKPFSARELIARVSNMLQPARLRRDVELQRNRLTAFIQQIPVGVAIFEGPEHRLVLCNETYGDIIGQPVEIGRTITELLPALIGSASVERLDRAYAGESIDSPEGRVVLHDDDGGERVRYFRSSIRPVRDIDGDVNAVISVSADITEQVLARQAVDHSRIEAEQANRAKDEFLAMLGHELRNPLAPILTALELMRLRGERVYERERAVIERQTQHLAGLVDDLLDVSRITRGMVQLRKERVALSRIVAKAIETAAPLFEQQGHQLSTSVPHDLVVDGDEARLTQVFANLLTNAAKYTDAGGRITVEAALEGDEIVARVEDSGRGIAADILPRVFDLFVQERQNLDRSRGGLGLGLAIVRSLVQLHGGTVTAASPGPGHGSTFVVRMPSGGTLPIAAAETRRAHDTQPASGRAVLIVDDNVDAAMLLSELLQSLGYATRVAHDGIEALSIAQTFVPDVALLDIGLPAMDGYELARRLRELPAWRAVRLLAVTGYGQASDRGRSSEAGFDHHLVKPIDLATLQKLMPQA